MIIEIETIEVNALSTLDLADAQDFALIDGQRLAGDQP